VRWLRQIASILAVGARSTTSRDHVSSSSLVKGAPSRRILLADRADQRPTPACETLIRTFEEVAQGGVD
jgi:hypothetical protein